MKCYKGFNKDLQCTPDGKVFQYEIGKEYVEKSADLCKSGFHACEHPLDCFNYYDPANSRFCEVELDEVSDKRDGDDTKRCGKRIRIGAELDIKGLIKAAFEYTRERCNSNETGGNWSALTGGDWSALTGGYKSALTGGYWSALTGGDSSALTGGDWSALTGGNSSALRGGYKSALTGGNWSALTGGNSSALRGGYKSALTGGNWSALTGGDWSALTGGYKSALTGGNSSALRGGVGSKFKGGMWAVFVCEIRDDNYKLIGMKTAVVDGETIKPDTWYTLKGGEFVEVEE